MKISKYVHSCILVEEGSQKILFDPGSYGFSQNLVKPEQFTGINAIVITHKHGDHAATDAIKVILDNNKGAKVIANSETAEVLKEAGIEAEVLETGETKIGDIVLKAFQAAHGPVPIPVPANTAYVVNDMFTHPGDSLDPVIFEHQTELIALPIDGSWLKWVESLDFAANFKAKQIIPVHDGHIKDFYLTGQYKKSAEILAQKGIGFANLMNPGDSIEI